MLFVYLNCGLKQILWYCARAERAVCQLISDWLTSNFRFLVWADADADARITVQQLSRCIWSITVVVNQFKEYR